MGSQDRKTGDCRGIEERYLEMFNNAPLGVFRTSLDGQFLDVNPKLAQLLGFDDPAEVIGFYGDLATEVYADPEARGRMLQRLIQQGQMSFEGVFRDCRGEKIDAEVHLRIVADDDGEPLYIEGLAADITCQKEAERELFDNRQQLEESDRRYRTLFDSAADAIFLYSENGRIRDANRVACERLGFSREELLSMRYDDIIEPEYARRYREWMPQILSAGESFAARTEHVTKDGEIIPIEMNARAVALSSGMHVICTARDISVRLEAESALRRSREIIEQEVFERTAQLNHANKMLQREIEQRAENEEHIRVLAMYDTLTGLANRSLIIDRLRQTTATTYRTGGTSAVLYIDLNNFKPINDRFGHLAGDQALRQVAQRLQECLREVDTAGRIGGDEFVVILQGLTRREDVELVVERIIETMNEPVLLDGEEYYDLGISIGICFCPRHGFDVDTLIRRADRAMYEAKATGKSAYRYCHEEEDSGDAGVDS